MKKAITYLLLFALASAQLWADPGPTQAHAESVKKKIVKCLDQHRLVVIETYDGTRSQGVVSEAGKDDFVLAYAGRATTLSYQDVKKISWQTPRWNQVRIALATVVIAGAVIGIVTLIRGLHNG